MGSGEMDAQRVYFSQLCLQLRHELEQDCFFIPASCPGGFIVFHHPYLCDRYRALDARKTVNVPAQLHRIRKCFRDLHPGSWKPH